MHLTRLHIHRVRNLREVSFSPHPQFNVFFGNNGSGKTSLLEAIYLLALGRSFRSRQIQSVIRYQESSLACFAEIHKKEDERITLGLEKGRQGSVKCKIQGEICTSLSEFAQILPIQLMTPETFKLLNSGSIERRKLIDWGVFHVEPSFGRLCLRYQRLLKQRNAALKTQVQVAELRVWDKELAHLGEEIALQRERYIAQWMPFVDAIGAQLFPELSLAIQYERGWGEQPLEDTLALALNKDKRWGFTTVGPHRAEINFTVQQFSAHQVLSRGQQKLLISGLQIAQARALLSTMGKQCLYLLDDLTSELDQDNRLKVFRLLAEQGHQVFLTGADLADWEGFEEHFSGQMFHVEHGQVSLHEMFHVEHP